MILRYHLIVLKYGGFFPLSKLLGGGVSVELLG